MNPDQNYAVHAMVLVWIATAVLLLTLRHPDDLIYSGKWVPQQTTDNPAKVAKDAIKQYSLIPDDGNGGEICTRAQAVSSAEILANDFKAYAYWKGVEVKVCAK